MGINKIILLGNISSDIKVDDFNGNKKVSFSIATNETYKKDGEKITNVEFHNCTAWKGLAGVIEQFVKKGQQLYLEGKQTHRKYEKDGKTKYFSEVIVSNIELLGGKTESKENNNYEQGAPDNKDGLPF